MIAQSTEQEISSASIVSSLAFKSASTEKLGSAKKQQFGSNSTHAYSASTNLCSGHFVADV